MFHVGQRVVCVDTASGYGIWWPDERPIEGNVYTITGVYVDDDGDEMLRLAEIKRHPAVVELFNRDGYLATRFRPIVERETDISFAHEILRKATKRKTVKTPVPSDVWNG